MNKTKIEWCDFTWNPVTGCLHGCPYCYAERIVSRFSAHVETNCEVIWNEQGQEGPCRVIDEPWTWDGKIQPYPFGFKPTFHRYRLDEPQKIKKPSRIFVCSMADLFGEWVPDEWIEQVFEACEAAPQHTYLFLTKNGSRYEQLGLLPNKQNFWYGTTRTGINSKLECGSSDHSNTFLSLEPLLAPLDAETLNAIELWRWVIVGAQTPKPRHDPAWVQAIIDKCREEGVPLFLKDNLKWPEKIQEFPS